MQGEQQHGGADGAAVGQLCREYLVHKRRGQIGNHDFAEIPAQEQTETGGKIVPVPLTILPKLGKQAGCALNRPCDQLGKEGNVQRVISKVLFRLHPPSVYINDVGKGLKGIK